MNKLQYIMNASPEKRYKNFINTVANQCHVWVLRADDGYATFDAEGFINLMVWPKKEYAQFFADDDEEPEGIEIHDFIERCKDVKDDTIRFMVFPTEKDSYIISVENLQEDIEAQLKKI